MDAACSAVRAVRIHFDEVCRCLPFLGVWASGKCFFHVDVDVLIIKLYIIIFVQRGTRARDRWSQVLLLKHVQKVFSTTNYCGNVLSLFNYIQSQRSESDIQHLSVSNRYLDGWLLPCEGDCVKLCDDFLT